MACPIASAGVAISPWANLTHSGASASVRDGLHPLCSTAFLDTLARTFLAGELPAHPDASPVFAPVHGLPPMLVQIGENEVMLSDAIRLAAHLGESRVRTSLEVWPGMFHVWHQFAGLMPEADQAMRNAVRFHGVIVQYWAHNNLITNSHFDGTRLDSIDLHGEDEYANEITGNPVTNSQRAAIALGNSGGGHDNIGGHDKTGVDNWIHDNDLVGNTLGISVEFGTEGTTIEGNRIRDNASLSPVSPRGIVLGSSSGTRVSGNTISNNTVPGFVAVYLKDNAAEGTEPAGGPKNWTISGNTVTNSGTAFKDAAAYDSGNTIQTTW